MSKLKANYHTHNQLCNHAVGDSESYVLKAIELGMEELGLSDHAPIPLFTTSAKDFIRNWSFRNMSYDVFENVYLPEVNEVIEKYSNQIKLYKAVETEYNIKYNDYYKSLRDRLDYMLLGMHYFYIGDKCINSYGDINYTNVKYYAQTSVEAMESGLFKIFAHPDLFMFSYKNINGERKFDDEAIKCTRTIIESAIKNDVYLELNCNGLYNSYKRNSKEWLYPYKEFWMIVKEYKDAKVIISADAHNPNDLAGEYIKEVINFAKEMGLKIQEKIEF